MSAHQPPIPPSITQPTNQQAKDNSDDSCEPNDTNCDSCYSYSESCSESEACYTGTIS